MPPSAFSICPRIRVGCCAKAAFAKSNAMATAPSVQRVIFGLYIMNLLPIWFFKASLNQADNPNSAFLFLTFS
jgi:hypothetical protein